MQALPLTEYQSKNQSVDRHPLGRQASLKHFCKMYFPKIKQCEETNTYDQVVATEHTAIES
jgi:hypothetical protein